MKRNRRRLNEIRDSHINEYPAVVNESGDIIYIIDNDGREVTLEEFLDDNKKNKEE